MEGDVCVYLRRGMLCYHAHIAKLHNVTLQPPSVTVRSSPLLLRSLPLNTHLVVGEDPEGVELHLGGNTPTRWVPPGDNTCHKGAMAQPIFQCGLVSPVGTLPAQKQARQTIIDRS